MRHPPDKAHLLVVGEGRLFETPYRSVQLPLWELSDTEWLKVLRRPPYAPRCAPSVTLVQAALFSSHNGDLGQGRDCGRVVH